jgi:hypothetical protein
MLTLQGAHAAAVKHRCGHRPFHLNMSLSRPSALSDPMFQDPWVQSNVAITYDALKTKDGLGSQLQRQLGVYTVAACTGLQYKPTDGFQRFTHLDASEAHLMAQRLNTLLGIPNTHQPVNSSWRVVDIGRDCGVNWEHLLNETKAALAQQQPTLFNISFVYGFVLTYPAMLDCVPAFRPQVGCCGQCLCTMQGYDAWLACAQMGVTPRLRSLQSAGLRRPAGMCSDGYAAVQQHANDLPAHDGIIHTTLHHTRPHRNMPLLSFLLLFACRPRPAVHPCYGLYGWQYILGLVMLRVTHTGCCHMPTSSMSSELSQRWGAGLRLLLCNWSWLPGPWMSQHAHSSSSSSTDYL